MTFMIAIGAFLLVSGLGFFMHRVESGGYILLIGLFLYYYQVSFDLVK